ncbi:tyrosine-protein kinase STYK1b [Spinachia spinachia]
MSSKKVVELFYDVVSPYSWLGFEIMCRYRNVWNIELKLRPALLGGVMQGSGNKPPGLVPNKFRYMGQDLARLSKYFDVALQTPADPFEAMFQKGSLNAMRFITAVQEREKLGDNQVERVSRELWKRIWREDKDITEPSSLSEAATKAGLSDSEIKEVLELSSSKEIKDKLKSATQIALDHGAFGFPLVVCHVNGKPEVFFGSDRFELMAHCIGEKWLGPQPDKSASKLMSSVAEGPSQCQQGDSICEIRVYEQEVIIVPVLLLAAFLVTLVFILLLHFCPEKVDRIRPKASRPASRRVLHGIDAPPGINVMEHESIALDMPSTYSTFERPENYTLRPLHHLDIPSKSVVSASLSPLPPPQPQIPSFTPIAQPRELPRQRLPESFKLVTPLPSAFSLQSEPSVSLYRARMENRNVVLRVLTDTADATERQSFLGFASFLAQLGPHPFLPELLGVVSLRAPLVTVVEELENRDLLSYLWRCREEHVDPPCEITERRMFTMAKQVASALEFLHNKDLLHGNIRARSVLVTKDSTAKLWGLHGVYTRKSQGATQKEDPSMKKWQAPELLTKRAASQSSDIWSFGLLLYEMATMGEVPFAEIPVNELLQFHQRGKCLKKPSNCSNALYSVIKSCCQWKDQDRPSLAEVSRKVLSGEKNASDKVLKVSGPVNIEKYLREAGYGETNSYTVF